MANFIVSYDLNGPIPSHRQVDDVLRGLGASRVLETVWWIGYAGTAAALRDRLKTTLRSEDRLLVIEAKSAAWNNLLVNGDSLIRAWNNAA